MTLDELLALAERATPADKRDFVLEMPWADGEFCAATTPEVVKALVAVAQAAERQLRDSPDWSEPHVLVALDALRAVLAR